MKGNVFAFRNPEDKKSCNVINPLKTENNPILGGGQSERIVIAQCISSFSG